MFAVYKELGPGLLENIYEAALVYELKKRGLKVEQQKQLQVYYDGKLLPIDYRVDLMVEDKVILELKSVAELKDVHFKQLLTYLKITKKRVGLLVNFNTDDIVKSTRRVIC